MAQFEAKEIGARIAAARNEAGLTQEELAELAPFSTRSLQDYERGLTIPYKQMRELSRLLDRPVEWFLHGDRPDEVEAADVMEKLAGLDERLGRVEEMLRRIDQRLAAQIGIDVADTSGIKFSRGRPSELADPAAEARAAGEEAEAAAEQARRQVGRGVRTRREKETG